MPSRIMLPRRQIDPYYRAKGCLPGCLLALLAGSCGLAVGALGAGAPATPTPGPTSTITSTVTAAPVTRSVTASASAAPAVTRTVTAPAVTRTATVTVSPRAFAAPAPKRTLTPDPEPEAGPRAPVGGYRSCAQARAAGAAPLYRGQPGYRPKLDRDDDGVACE